MRNVRCGGCDNSWFVVELLDDGQVQMWCANCDASVVVGDTDLVGQLVLGVKALKRVKKKEPVADVQCRRTGCDEAVTIYWAHRGYCAEHAEEAGELWKKLYWVQVPHPMPDDPHAARMVTKVDSFDEAQRYIYHLLAPELQEVATIWEELVRDDSGVPITNLLHPRDPVVSQVTSNLCCTGNGEC